MGFRISRQIVHRCRKASRSVPHLAALGGAISMLKTTCGLVNLFTIFIWLYSLYDSCRHVQGVDSIECVCEHFSDQFNETLSMLRFHLTMILLKMVSVKMVSVGLWTGQPWFGDTWDMPIVMLNLMAVNKMMSKWLCPIYDNLMTWISLFDIWRNLSSYASVCSPLIWGHWQREISAAAA